MFDKTNFKIVLFTKRKFVFFNFAKVGKIKYFFRNNFATCVLIDSETITFDEIKKLKNNFLTFCFPLIFLCFDEKKLAAAIEAGIDDYVIMPIDKKNLLLKIEMNILRSRRDLNANPLTKLPGNFLIERVISQKEKNQTILHVDINNFKNYNDKHGFEKGDKVILGTAKMLAKIIDKNDFLGHIGGDDFIVVTKNSKIKDVIKENFEKKFKGLSVSVK